MKLPYHFKRWFSPLIFAYLYQLVLVIKGIKIRRKYSCFHIPHGPYCYTLVETGKLFPRRVRCPYWDYNPLAISQFEGYCHFVKRGDWQYNSVGLLFDMCKECNVREEEYEESMNP